MARARPARRSLGIGAAAGAELPAPTARRAAMAASSLRRWPSEATPRSLRSSAVSSGRTSASMSLSRNACSYWPKPSPRSQAPTSTPVPPIGRARPRQVQSIPSRRGARHGTARAGRLLVSPIAGKVVRVAFDGGRLTSDAGVLVLAEIERRLGIAERLARCLEDPRAPERVHHTLAEMIRFRVLLIAAGYPDANDCDALRADPAFKMAVGRAPESGADLCSQPTMCRLENLPGATALKRMMAAMVELFCDSFERGAAPDRARHRRHRGPGPRPPAARAVPRPLRRAAASCRSTSTRRSRGKPVAVILRPGKTPDGAEVALVLRHVIRAHPRPLAQGRHPGPRRQPLRPARGDELVRAQPGRLRLRPGRQQGPARAGRGPRRGGGAGPGRGRGREGPPLRRVPLRRQDLERRAAGDRPGRGVGQGQRTAGSWSPTSPARRAGSTRSSTAPAARRRIWSRPTSCHLASDRTSCSKATANQFRLVLHTAAYWLLHTLRGLAPKRSFWRDAQFDTIRLALIKVVGRVTELATRIKLALPSDYPYRDSLTLLAARAARPP